MKTTINIPEEYITNRVNSSKVALLITIIAISVMMIITAQIGEFERSSIVPPIIVVATICAIISAAVIAMSLKRAVYTATESPLATLTFVFAGSKRDEVIKAVESNLWSSIPSLTKDSDGTAMKLEVVYSKDNNFAAYQLFTYVPHEYRPTSEIGFIDKEDIARINFSKLKM